MAALHPRLAAAADGRLPEWADAGGRRRAHMARVADVMGEWARGRGLGPADVARWRAAAFLHDALHDADPATLRPLVSAPFDTMHGKTLHGPAAAARLRSDGVDDPPLLFALEYHTLGHPELDELGRSLYIADFLEPGRDYLDDRLVALRERMPDALDAVMYDVAAARIRRNIGKGRPLSPPTVEFWNGLVADRAARERAAQASHG